jgi:hypothetical protein
MAAGDSRASQSRAQDRSDSIASRASRVSEATHHSHQSVPGAFEEPQEESTVIQDKGKGKESTQGRIVSGLGSVTDLDLTDPEQVQSLLEAALAYRNHYKETKIKAGQYAHKLLQAQEQNEINKAQFERELEQARATYPILATDDTTTSLHEEIAQLQLQNQRLQDDLRTVRHSATMGTSQDQINHLQDQLDQLQREQREGTGGTTASRTTEFNPLTYRPRAEGPKEALDGSSVEKYHGWRFAVDQKFEEDRIYYGDNDKRKVAYALKNMVAPIFNTMPRFVTSKPESTYLPFMAELEKMMGVHLEIRNAKKELRHIAEAG